MSKRDRIKKMAKKKLANYENLLDTLKNRVKALDNEIYQLEKARRELFFEIDNIKVIIGGMFLWD